MSEVHKPLVDLDSVRQLIRMMVDNDLIELTLRQGEEELSLRRPEPHRAAPPMPVGQAASPAAYALPASGPAGEPAVIAAAELARSSDAGLLVISSPMVGSFYAASAPDAAPFVEVGTAVQPGMVVCIIEAMKVFNEIKAEVAGTVVDVMVTNRQAVEFGQPLFKLRPSP